MSLILGKDNPRDSQYLFFSPNPPAMLSQCVNAAASMAWSLFPTLLNSACLSSKIHLFFQASLSSMLSSLLLLFLLKEFIFKKGLLPTLIPAATESAADLHPNKDPMTIIFPTHGGAGIAARCMPRGVKINCVSPLLLDTVKAPNFSRLSTAASIDSCAGGSKRPERKAPDPISRPRKRRDKSVWSRAHLLISGSPCSGNFSNVLREIIL
mmetsp:Transcript_23238/g.27476  ORF Transcript_23238/g.27476 Transcript_23238/m.27476 type:complete len:210 (-) Transcript_23238:1762-2391(-)